MFGVNLINKDGPFRAFGKPVVDILLDGKRAMDWISFRVELNGMGAVDSFDVTLPWEVTELPPRDELLFSSPTQSSDLVFGHTDIKISAGFEGEEISDLIEGKMDYPVWDFSTDSGEIVTINGRSYGAAPFDFKESEKWQNMTSTGAFKQIAVQHGLNPVVPVETGTLLGEYEKEDHVNMKREVSHWDFVLYMCQSEGFVTRVRGKDWFFGPRENLPNWNKEPLNFAWGYNIEEPFRIERAPNAARNLIVEVMSWIPGKKVGNKTQKGQRIVEKASFVGSSTGHKYNMRYYFPNLTRDQCQRKARSILADLSRNQLYGSFSADWFPELDNDRKINILGVGQGLSQTYFVTKVVISGSKGDGLKSEITFSNLPLEEGGRFG